MPLKILGNVMWSWRFRDTCNEVYKCGFTILGLTLALKGAWGWRGCHLTLHSPPREYHRPPDSLAGMEAETHRGVISTSGCYGASPGN